MHHSVSHKLDFPTHQSLAKFGALSVGGIVDMLPLS